MRSTDQYATSLTGSSNTRSHAQNHQNKPQGFGKVNQSTQRAEDVSEGKNKPFDVWLDYCRLSLTIGSREDVTDISDFVTGKFSDVMVWEDKPRSFQHQYWDNVGKSAGGILMSYRLPDRDRGIAGEMVVILKGDVIESICRHRLLWMLFSLWKEYQARCTRLDLKLDDYERSLDLEWLKARTKDGSYYRFRRAKPMEEYAGTRLISDGACFGSQESEIYFRVYDKALESKGKEDWIRLEGQYGGDTADHLFNELMNLYDQHKSDRNCAQLISRDVMPVLFNMRLGLLFLEQKTDEDGAYDTRNRGRNKPLDYWHEFMLRVYKFFCCDGLKFDPKKPVVKPSLERSINFLQRSVANAYSAVSIVYGKEFAESLILKGFDQLSRMHKAMVNKAQMEMQNAMDRTTDIAMQIRQSLEYVYDEE